MHGGIHLDSVAKSRHTSVVGELRDDFVTPVGAEPGSGMLPRIGKHDVMHKGVRRDGALDVEQDESAAKFNHAAMDTGCSSCGSLFGR